MVISSTLWVIASVARVTEVAYNLKLLHRRRVLFEVLNVVVTIVLTVLGLTDLRCAVHGEEDSTHTFFKVFADVLLDLLRINVSISGSLTADSLLPIHEIFERFLFIFLCLQVLSLLIIFAITN